MSSILKAYQRTLNKYPIIVQSIQVGALMGIGDTIAQNFIEEKTKPFDFKRNRNFIFLGTFVVGPASSFWYKILDKFIKGKKSEVALKKVCCDQFLFAPAFLFLFLTMLETLERGSMKEAQKAVKANYFDILKANYTVWPVVQLGNFYLIPVNYQTLIVQMVALVWNIYLSWKTHLK